MQLIVDFFLTAPIEIMFILTFLIILAAFESGLLLGKLHRKHAQKEDRSPIGSLVGAALGLLAFLLAFTFGLAASKFDERRNLVVDEANAIATTYLRAGYLMQPYQNKIRFLLEEYTSTRLEALKPGKLEEGIKKSEDLQNQLWLQAIEVVEKNPVSIAVGLFVQSLNETIDLHTKRINFGVRIRIPLVIWISLYFVTILAIGCVGYQFGLFHTRYMGITLLLILSFTSVLILIADLDRPQEGLIKVSQQSLIDLIDKFNEIHEAI